MLEENGVKLELAQLNFHQGSRNIKSLTPTPRSSSTSVAATAARNGGTWSFNEFDVEETELLPPVAFFGCSKQFGAGGF